MTEQITLNFQHPIALFPLPGSVLLPHSVMPLHIFEPRYRQMTREALDAAGLIAMALFEKQITEQAYLHDAPALRPDVCVGYVERYESLDDGRYLIMLRGLCRARIIHEVATEKPYRMAMLQPTEYPPSDDQTLEPQRLALQRGLDDPALSRLAGLRELRQLFDRNVPTVGLIDLLISMLVEDTSTRYAMLREASAHKRAAFLRNRLAQLQQSVRQSEEN